jgi:hypothetical protein
MVEMREQPDTDDGPALDDKVPALANVPSKRALVSRRNGQRGGRPPIEIDLQMVKKLASFMSTDREIATFLGLSARTVARAKKHSDFQQAMDQGRNLARLNLRRAQWAAALGGNITMMIFLAKCYLGMLDRGGSSTDDPFDEIRITVRRPEPREH